MATMALSTHDNGLTPLLLSSSFASFHIECFHWGSPSRDISALSDRMGVPGSSLARRTILGTIPTYE